MAELVFKTNNQKIRERREVATTQKTIENVPKGEKPPQVEKPININPAQYDYTCYIVGGGPSLKNFDWTLLDDPTKFVIVLNTAYMKLPNAQVLYCTDPPWIQDNIDGLRKFKGHKWQGVLHLNKPPKLDVIDKQWHLTGPDGYETKEGCMRHGSNSTYAAINLVVAHLKFKKIYLLGIDMKWGERNIKSSSHWHSDFKPHRRVDGEAVYVRMRDAYKTLKPTLDQLGIEVINVNTPTGTNLEVFPILPVEQVFKRELDKKKEK